MNEFNLHILKELRKHITIVSEPLHNEIQAIIEYMSIEERKIIFYGWGAPGHANWLYDDELLGLMTDEQLPKFVSIVNRLTQHPRHEKIFAVYFKNTMVALIPGKTEEQISEELHKRIMLL